MALVELNWRPDAKALRKFGVVVIVGLGVIGLALQLWGGRADLAWLVYGAAAVIGLPALTGTVVALPGYWLWMGMAFVMGNIMGRLLLALVYYGLITPMGLVRRLFTDPLMRRRPGVDSYWVEVDATGEKTRYERQF